MSEEQGQEPQSQGFEMMDFSKFLIVEEKDIATFIRPHHIIQMCHIMKSAEETVGFDPSVQALFRELAVDSKHDLKENERRFIAEKYAAAYVRMLQGRQNFTSWAESKAISEEYLGLNGKYEEEFKHELEHTIRKLLEMEKKDKVVLRFKPDAMCVIAQGGRGPVAHCNTDEIFKEDMAVWFAINDVLSRDVAYSNQAGFVNNHDGSYDIWIEAGLLRNLDFLEKVRDRHEDLERQLLPQ